MSLAEPALARRIAPVSGLLMLGFAITLSVSTAAAEHTRTTEPATRYDGLDAADVTVAERTVQQALERAPSRATRFWQRAANGSWGAVTPLRTFRARGGYYCREFREWVVTGNGTEMVHISIACRDRDGIWKAAGR